MGLVVVGKLAKIKHSLGVANKQKSQLVEELVDATEANGSAHGALGGSTR